MLLYGWHASGAENENHLTQQAESLGKTSFGTRIPHIEQLSLRSRHRGVFLPGCRTRGLSRASPDATGKMPHQGHRFQEECAGECIQRRSGVDSTLDLAYRQTRYIIESPSGEFVLKVEELNPAVDSLLKDYRADSCAFITAWNPSSQRLTEPANEQRQRDLIAEVRRRGYTFLPGRGIGGDPSWPPEPSIFIIGISGTDAEDLGARFGQLAIIAKRIGEPVQLRYTNFG